MKDGTGTIRADELTVAAELKIAATVGKKRARIWAHGPSKGVQVNILAVDTTERP